jgi:hypothetical protein
MTINNNEGKNSVLSALIRSFTIFIDDKSFKNQDFIDNFSKTTLPILKKYNKKIVLSYDYLEKIKKVSKEFTQLKQNLDYLKHRNKIVRSDIQDIKELTKSLLVNANTLLISQDEDLCDEVNEYCKDNNLNGPKPILYIKKISEESIMAQVRDFVHPFTPLGNTEKDAAAVPNIVFDISSLKYDKTNFFIEGLGLEFISKYTVYVCDSQISKFEKEAEICSYVQDFYSKVVREYGAITSFEKHAGKKGEQIVFDLVSESNVAVLVEDDSIAPDYYNINKKYELKNKIIPFKIINNEINCKYENAWKEDIIKLYDKIKEDLSKNEDSFNKYAELAKKQEEQERKLKENNAKDFRSKNSNDLFDEVNYSLDDNSIEITTVNDEFELTFEDASLRNKPSKKDASNLNSNSANSTSKDTVSLNSTEEQEKSENIINESKDESQAIVIDVDNVKDESITIDIEANEEVINPGLSDIHEEEAKAEVVDIDKVDEEDQTVVVDTSEFDEFLNSSAKLEDIEVNTPKEDEKKVVLMSLTDTSSEPTKQKESSKKKKNSISELIFAEEDKKAKEEAKSKAKTQNKKNKEEIVFLTDDKKPEVTLDDEETKVSVTSLFDDPEEKNDNALEENTNEVNVSIEETPSTEVQTEDKGNKLAKITSTAVSSIKKFMSKDKSKDNEAQEQDTNTNVEINEDSTLEEVKADSSSVTNETSEVTEEPKVESKETDTPVVTSDEAKSESLTEEKENKTEEENSESKAETVSKVDNNENLEVTEVKDNSSNETEVSKKFETSKETKEEVIAESDAEEKVDSETESISENNDKAEVEEKHQQKQVMLTSSSSGFSLSKEQLQKKQEELKKKQEEEERLKAEEEKKAEPRKPQHVTLTSNASGFSLSKEQLQKKQEELKKKQEEERLKAEELAKEEAQNVHTPKTVELSGTSSSFNISEEQRDEYIKKHEIDEIVKLNVAEAENKRKLADSLETTRKNATIKAIEEFELEGEESGLVFDEVLQTKISTTTDFEDFELTKERENLFREYENSRRNDPNAKRNLSSSNAYSGGRMRHSNIERSRDSLLGGINLDIFNDKPISNSNQAQDIDNSKKNPVDLSLAIKNIAEKENNLKQGLTDNVQSTDSTKVKSSLGVNAIESKHNQFIDNEEIEKLLNVDGKAFAKTGKRYVSLQESGYVEVPAFGHNVLINDKDYKLSNPIKMNDYKNVYAYNDSQYINTYGENVIDVNFITKLRAMKLSNFKNDNVDWPNELIQNSLHDFVGTISNKVNGEPVAKIFKSIDMFSRKKNRLSLIKIAKNFVTLVATLNKDNIFLGGLDLNSILVTEDDEVSISNIEFCQIGDFALVNQYNSLNLAPEHMDTLKPYANQHSENYIVALFIFNLLFLGKSPFVFSKSRGLDENLYSAFRFPIDILDSMIPPSDVTYYIWSYLPNYIKQAFIKTFNTGYHNVQARTTVAEWEELLSKWYHEGICKKLSAEELTIKPMKGYDKLNPEDKTCKLCHYPMTREDYDITDGICHSCFNSKGKLVQCEHCKTSFMVSYHDMIIKPYNVKGNLCKVCRSQSTKIKKLNTCEKCGKKFPIYFDTSSHIRNCPACTNSVKETKSEEKESSDKVDFATRL